MRICIALLSAVTLLLCGLASSCQSNSGTTKTTQQTPAPEKPTTGTLVVWTQGQPEGGEGYVTFFLVNSSGSRVDEAHLMKLGASESITLPPDSRYELVSYIRDCPENPENCIMGPSAPVDECRAAFTLNVGETLYARRYAEHTGGRQTRCWLSITHLPLTDGERQLHAWQNIARSPYMVIESATPPSKKDTRIIDSVPAPKDEAIRKIQRALLSFKQATVMSSPVSGRTPDGECHGVDTRNPSDMFPVAVGHCRFTTTTLKQLILIAYYPLWGTVGKSTELIKGGPRLDRL